MTPRRAQLLFVYGSLKRGLANHRLLRGAEFAGACRTALAYELVTLGVYPALRSGTRAIMGELYGVDTALLLRLDVFEGDEYQRRQVELLDGRRVEAYFLASGAPARISPWPRDSWP